MRAELCFLLTGPGPFPGLLDMWGGGGGLIEYRSALLASRGYASMALEYLKPEEQSSELGFGYFEVCVVHFDSPKNKKTTLTGNRVVCFCADCL